MDKCRFDTQEGRRCEGRAIGSHGGCWNHDPDFELERKRNARRGGKRAGRGRPLLDVHDIAAQLQTLCEKVLSGELERADAAVCGQLLNYKGAAIATALTVRQQEELEARLEDVEAVLGGRKEGA